MTPFIKTILAEEDPAARDKAYNEAVKKYKKLSPRKQLFIDQVVLHGNHTAAYQTAYPNCTAAAAKSSASRLMADPVIAECITKGRNKARVMIGEFLRQRCLAKFADISEKRSVLTRIIRGDIMVEKEVIDKFGEKQVIKVKPDLDERIRAITADEKLEAKWERQLPQLMNLFNILDDPYQSLEDYDAFD